MAIDKRLNLKLDSIFSKHDDTTSLSFWKDFYDFIVMSYHIKNRHGMTSLSKVLKEKGVVNQEQILNIYGHGLFLLARYNQEDIYRGGFCV
ncbi:MAG: hypothetical protein N4Q81_01900 [Lactobacillus iners]|nr:hypothetical protein [Lactobacillus iners]